MAWWWRARRPRALQPTSRPRWTNGARSSRLPASRARIERMISRRSLMAASAAATLAPAWTASAQAWPNRPVRLVVPFTPGGGIDAIGRIVGARLAEIWGQQVVVENKPGGATNIASEFVARSA